MMQKTKICICCQADKPLNRFGIMNNGGRVRICSACMSTRYRAQIRLELYAAFDWKCSCCGESHPQFLTLEHIQGGVYRANKLANKIHQSYVELSKAKSEGWDRSKYELLCMNCNWAKGRFGQCPHRSGVTKDVWIESLKKKAAFRSDYDPRPNLAKAQLLRHPRKAQVSKVIDDLEKTLQ